MKGVAIASGNRRHGAGRIRRGKLGGVRAHDERRGPFHGLPQHAFHQSRRRGPGEQRDRPGVRRFLRRYIQEHPEALSELHSLREFEYPLPQNMPDGKLRRLRTVKQYNGNYLVWDGIGVDGLKTGHLDEENFTAATTARRGDTRLIAVVLGVPGRTLTEGARNRTDDTVALLSYGFRNYSTFALDPPFCARPGSRRDRSDRSTSAPPKRWSSPSVRTNGKSSPARSSSTTPSSRRS